jgi:uncharacterized protein YndB with AHSA1/START domain
MVQLRNSIAIDATADAVWKVLGDLEATTEWLPGTVAARMDGQIRTCTTAEGLDIREEITDYSPERRSYRFKHLALPMPVANSGGTFIIEYGGNGASRFVLETSFEALDSAQEEQIAQMMDGALQQALESLKRRVEQGLRWDAAPASRQSSPGGPKR